MKESKFTKPQIMPILQIIVITTVAGIYARNLAAQILSEEPSTASGAGGTCGS